MVPRRQRKRAWLTRDWVMGGIVMRRMRILWLLVWLIQPVYGQIVTGSIVGTVQDPGGLAVPAVKVILTQPATGLQRTAETNDSGTFVFSGLESGEYVLAVAKEGFKRAERRGLVLTTGERLPAGVITLELGAVAETVSVTAQAAALKTESAERAGVITGVQAENLMILGRNVDGLVGLLPGVVMTGDDPDSFSGGANYRVLGSRDRANSISVDGTPVTDTDSGGGKRLSVSQDAVAEVKILISNYQAEYGRMSGSNMLIVTKSGARDFHGLGSYFKRHEQFNASDFFDNRLGRRKPRYRFNTWTYNLGGPVYLPNRWNRNRDKLFFFWGQEYWPTRNSNTANRTMPTELERGGDFSRSLDVNDKLIVIQDPANRTPFPANTIPRSRLDPSGQSLLKLLPMPNYLNRSISKGSYNYVYTNETQQPERTDTLKVDYNLTNNHSVVGSYSGYYPTTTGFITNGVNGNWPQMRYSYLAPTRTIGLRYTAIFTPTLVNEFGAGWLYRKETNEVAKEDLQRDLRTTVGFLAGQFHPENNPLGLIPNASFGGVPSAPTIGFDGRFPFNFFQNVVNLDEKLTLIRGAHTFKGGLYYEYFDRNMPVQGLVFNGSVGFGRNVNNPLDTGYAFANAALGVFDSYSEATAKPTMHPRANVLNFFTQDNWKITSRLTLDYGLRGSWMPPIYDKYGQMAGFVPSRYDPAQGVSLIRPGLDASRKRVGVHPATGQLYPATLIGAIAPGTGNTANGMVQAALDKSYPRALRESQGVVWEPRVGFAYNLFGNGKTAIRGGFGMVHDEESMAQGYKWLIAQPPIVFTPIINYGELKNLLSSSGLLFPSDVLGRDRNARMPLVMNYSLAIQQNVGFDTVLDVAYVGALGRSLYWTRMTNPVPFRANFNPANADPTLARGPLPPAFLRPLQGYNDINISGNGASSNYHSLQVSANRRFTRGMQFGAAWTWSKAMDVCEEDRPNQAASTISPFLPVRVWNYGLASWDRTHVVKINYLYELPKVPWSNPVVKYALNGWQFAGITTFQSGAPSGVGFATTTATDTTGTPSQGARVVVTGNPVLPKSERTFSRFFRTDVFRMPAAGTFGNAAKTLIRGPGINNWNASIMKHFPVHERSQLQFRLEMYNAFNHTQFDALDTTARFDPAGNQVNARLGEFTSSRSPRRMQMGLRFVF